MDIYELLELTPEQQKAFNALKRAYKKCGKLNMGFYNNYGTIGVYDKAKISHYDDDKSGILDRNQNCNQFQHPAGTSWADDPHYFHPVTK
jgi:hypothetical protein